MHFQCFQSHTTQLSPFLIDDYLAASVDLQIETGCQINDRKRSMLRVIENTDMQFSVLGLYKKVLSN